MRVVTLERIHFSDNEVIGLLRIVGSSFKCLTIERPWKNNTPNISCIPRGTYKIIKDTFGKAEPPYPNYKVLKVPGRTFIEFHAANKANQLRGCIALGAELAVMDNRIAITSSRNTHNDWMAFMNEDTDDEAALIISERR